MDYHESDQRVHYTAEEQTDYSLPESHCLREFDLFARQIERDLRQREARHSHFIELQHDGTLYSDDRMGLVESSLLLTELLPLYGAIKWIKEELEHSARVQLEQWWNLPPGEGLPNN